MKVIGIVVEYNPFHNGHLYQINEIKKMFPDSIIIVAASSSITMRGEFSTLNKWNKTKIALENNVDMVIEIPSIFTNQASDTFSYAAIKLLNEVKIDTLVFGSESNDLELLKKCANVQINNPKFDNLVKEYMSDGFNYPTALSKATEALINISIKESNDLLAISYIKEIIKNNYNIDLLPIKRTNNYKNNEENANIKSAYEIRELLKNNESIKDYIPYNKNLLENIDYDKYFELLKYKIISEKDKLTSIHLIDEGIETRIYKSALISNNINELIENIKTKRFTYNKINRILMNIFLDFTKEQAKEMNKITYLRILGLSKNGKKYLNSIKKEINMKILTKFEKEELLNNELKTTMLYSLITNNKNLIIEETKNHVIIY